MNGKTKKANRQSRHGVHSEDAFRVSFYLTAREKAIAVVLAEKLNTTFTEICKSGIQQLAVAHGIWLNGKVTEGFSEKVDVYERILNAEKKVGDK